MGSSPNDVENSMFLPGIELQSSVIRPVARRYNDSSIHIFIVN
jgi:hypothetical protein